MTVSCRISCPNPVVVLVVPPCFSCAEGRSQATAMLTGEPNPSTFGEPVTFTATVTSATRSDDSPAPGGTVTFRDRGVTIGTAPVDSAGNAVLTIDSLGPGAHDIVAVYSGDEEYKADLSGATQTVDQAASSTSLESSLNPSVEGEDVVLTATVSPAEATGTVTFDEGGVALGTGSVGNGTATLTINTLTVGDHGITAVYGGDVNTAGSTSGALTQTVNASAGG